MYELVTGRRPIFICHLTLYIIISTLCSLTTRIFYETKLSMSRSPHWAPRGIERRSEWRGGWSDTRELDPVWSSHPCFELTETSAKGLPASITENLILSCRWWRWPGTCPSTWRSSCRRECSSRWRRGWWSSRGRWARTNRRQIFSRLSCWWQANTSSFLSSPENRKYYFWSKY